MQKTCQKIVRVHNGTIIEIYDGLVTRSFTDNERALKELLMDDIGLDFQAMMEAYERLLFELAQVHHDNRRLIIECLPEGWLEWAKEIFQQEEELCESVPSGKSASSIL
jgi:hypothetical protein